MITFPPRNLPPDSEDWGRAVEDTLKTSRKGLASLGSSVGNLERATSGQLGSTEVQVGELLNRVTQTVDLPNFSVSGSSNAEPYNRGSFNVTFPAVSGARSAFFTLHCNVDTSPSGTINPVLFIRYQGSLIGRVTPLPTGTFPSDPVETGTTGNVSYFTRVNTSSDTPVTLNIEVARRGATLSTVTLTNVQATLTRTGMI